MNPQEAIDNPYWPNGSAVERAKDAAAHLDYPQVNGHEWMLTEHDVECLTAGAGILASGGGGNPRLGCERAVNVLKKGKQIKLVNPCRVDAKEMGIVCTVAIMGDPMAGNPEDGNEGALAALQCMQEVIAGDGLYSTRRDPLFPCYVADEEDLEKINVESVELAKKITALTPVEVGGLNITEPLLVSSENGLPCLDAAGQGRSYPELQMFMPFIYGKPYCPAVIADTTKKTVTCVAAKTCEDLEKLFRKETATLGSLLSIALGPIHFEDVFQNMVVFASSHAWQLGRAVDRALKTKTSFLDAIVEQERGHVLLKGTVTKEEAVNGDGFVTNYTTIKGTDEYKGNTVTVVAKNENYVVKKIDAAKKSEIILATTPDVITIVDLKAIQALDVAVMAGTKAKGKNVAVVILPTDPRLYSKKALEYVGPKALGLDMDYEEPKFLK